VGQEVIPHKEAQEHKVIQDALPVIRERQPRDAELQLQVLPQQVDHQELVGLLHDLGGVVCCGVAAAARVVGACQAGDDLVHFAVVAVGRRRLLEHHLPVDKVCMCVFVVGREARECEVAAVDKVCMCVFVVGREAREADGAGSRWDGVRREERGGGTD
jgi:hypothetical protein